MDLDLFLVCWIELPQLDEQDAPGCRTRRKSRGRRVADIAPGGKIAVLIRKPALEHEESFAAVVGVGGEATARRVANDGSGSRDLVADAVEHTPFDAGHRRWYPRQPRGVDGNAPGKISVDF